MRRFPQSALLALAIGTAILLAASAPLRAADAEEELVACKNQLQRIADAIAAYRLANNGQYPLQLGDLYDQFIDDLAVFQCPTARGSGITGPVNQGLKSPGEGDVAIVGYTWELGNENSWVATTAGGSMKWREFKLLQMKSPIGALVPILRCTHHTENHPGRVINLSANGELYTSGEYWETRFVDQLPGYRLAPIMIHLVQLDLAEMLPPRPRQATDNMLDLRAYYNGRFGDPWSPAVMGDEWQGFPMTFDNGIFVANEVPFDAAGVIHLNGALVSKRDNSRLPFPNEGFERLWFPTNAPPIIVDRTFRTLHVVGGVIFESAPSSIVARMQFTDIEGREIATWNWRYGEDVAISVPAFQASATRQERPIVAWEDSPITLRGKTVRLYQMSYNNPNPDVAVHELHFSMGDTTSAPFIAAITLGP